MQNTRIILVVTLSLLFSFGCAYADGSNPILKFEKGTIDTLFLSEVISNSQSTITKYFIVKTSDLSAQPEIGIPFLMEISLGTLIRDVSIVSDDWSGARKVNVFKLEIKEIKTPGIYEGQASIKCPNQTKCNFVIRLEIWPNDAIDIAEGDRIIERNLINSTFFINNWIQQDRAFGIEMTNSSNHTLEFQSTSIIREKSSPSIAEKLKISPPSLKEIRPDQPALVGFDISANSVKAGTYSGIVRVSDKTSSKPQTITLKINVKNGVLGAIIALLFGLIFGHMARQVDDSDAKLDLFKKIMGLVRRIDFSDLPELKKEELKSDLKKMAGKLEYAESTTDIQNIRNKIKDIEGKLEPETSNTDQRANPPIPEKTKEPEKESIWRFHKKMTKLLLQRPSLPYLFYVYRPYLYIISLMISLLLIFWEFYIQDPIFGESGIYDYIKIFLAGAGITIVANNLFSIQLSNWIKKFGKG